MPPSSLTIRALEGFDDPAFGRAEWNALLNGGFSNLVFLTWEWQKAWWQAFNRAGLMLLLAEREGLPIALAPLFTEEGMVYFVGSGGSDYLDFIGDVSQPGVLEALLQEARGRTPAFAGFLFYHVLESSPTGPLLETAAERLSLKLTDHGGMPAPMVDYAAHPEAAQALPEKKSLKRAERELCREGEIVITHQDTGKQILPHLREFMDQHIARWAATDYPSLFLEPSQRQFYEVLTALASDTGWLRFTRVEWQGRLIASHFGFSYGGSYLFYKPAFNVALSSRSPGQVLMRHLLIAAAEENAHRFDLGLGEEAFKKRFATGARQVKNHGLYRS